MKKKILLGVLIGAVCVSSIAGMAVFGETDIIPADDIDDAVTTSAPEATADPNVEMLPDVEMLVEPTAEASADPSITAVPKEEKEKLTKEELEKKKQDKKDTKIEAKDYIKDLKKLFKDADAETKKDILAQIAECKAELKDNTIGVFVKGENIDFSKYNDVYPVIEEDRTLIPIRAVAESLKADVKWEGETKVITITKDETVIVMKVDSKTATVNGVEVLLDAAPAIRGEGRTLVPIRFVSENMKLDVNWDEASRTVIID